MASTQHHLVRRGPQCERTGTLLDQHDRRVWRDRDYADTKLVRCTACG